MPPPTSISTLEVGPVRLPGKFMTKLVKRSAMEDHTQEITNNTRPTVNCKVENIPSNAMTHGEMDGTEVSWRSETWRSARNSLTEDRELRPSKSLTRVTISNQPVDSPETLGIITTLIQKRPLFWPEARVFFQEDSQLTSSTMELIPSRLDQVLESVRK